jgi:hypothetical protein
MDDKPKPPLVFANHVLKQMIEHSFGGDIIIKQADYSALRVAFRSAGGSWQEIGHGNMAHISLLGKFVSAWGNMPERERTGDQGLT